MKAHICRTNVAVEPKIDRDACCDESSGADKLVNRQEVLAASENVWTRGTNRFPFLVFAHVKGKHTHDQLKERHAEREKSHPRVVRVEVGLSSLVVVNKGLRESVTSSYAQRRTMTIPESDSTNVHRCMKACQS